MTLATHVVEGQRVLRIEQDVLLAHNGQSTKLPAGTLVELNSSPLSPQTRFVRVHKNLAGTIPASVVVTELSPSMSGSSTPFGVAAPIPSRLGGPIGPSPWQRVLEDLVKKGVVDIEVLKGQLQQHQIDPSSLTIGRLESGALIRIPR